MTGTLGPGGQRDGWKRKDQKEVGRTEVGLGLLTQLPRLTEALGARRETLAAWLQARPPRPRRVTAPAPLTPGAPRPLCYLPDLKYSSYYARMQKVKAGAGASSFPVWSPGRLAASVALAKRLAMHVVRPHPQVTKSETLGRGAASTGLGTASGPPDATTVPAKHSWSETSASLERETR